MSLNQKQELAWNSLIEEAVREEHEFEPPQTKKTQWRKIGEFLRDKFGFKEWELSYRVAFCIESKYFEKYGQEISIRTSYYYRTMRAWNWSENAQLERGYLGSEKKPVENVPEKISDDKQKNTTPLEGQQDSSTDREQKPEPPEVKYAMENKRIIDMLRDYGDAADMLRDYARHNPFLSEIDEGLMEDIFTRLNAWIINSRDYMNHKQLAPINSQLLFLQIYNGASDINNLFGLFFDEIKRVHTFERRNTKKSNQVLTSKEMKKYQRREVKNLNEILEFHSANEARMAGFYGQECTSCGGYRTQLVEGNTNRVVCIKCKDKSFVESMPREVFHSCRRCGFLVGDVKKGKCEHCEYEFSVPKELR